MRVDVTDLEQCKKAVTVEIPEEIVTRKINEAFRQVSSSTRLKGFRPGKVPKDLLKARFWDKIESEVIKDLVPEYFEKAVEEQKLQLVGQPEFEGELHVHENSPLSFKVVVTTWPKIELPQNYREIEIVGEKAAEVTEDDIMEVLKDLQEQAAKYQVITDRPLREGDLFVFDYDATEKANPSWSESKKDAVATVGSQQIPPGFSQNIIGMSKGEEKEFEEAFPADYAKPEVAGRNITFKINIKEIKEKVLPEIDDDFAKDWSNDSLASLKEEIAETIKKRREDEARSKMVNSLLNKLLDSTSIEPPEIMVENETDALVQDLEFRLAAQGRALEKTESNIALVRKDFRETAIRNVKASMILEEVAIREGIEVPPEEIDHHVQLLAKQYNKTAEEVKKVYKGKIEKTLQERKTLNFLLDHALIR
ncbi:MAG: trigger factor [bacterium]